MPPHNGRPFSIIDGARAATRVLVENKTENDRASVVCPTNWIFRVGAGFEFD